MYVSSIGPIGVNQIQPEGRIIKVVNGDSWKVDMNLHVPETYEPVTPDACTVEFVLSENRFVASPHWVGTWYDGVYPDEHVEGLVHVKVPLDVSRVLRRGVYSFSVRVTAALGGATETECTGYFQVEYEPTSDLHDIPYRHGTDDGDTDEEDPGTVTPLGKRFEAHAADKTIHVTLEDRERWDTTHIDLTFDEVPTEGSDRPVKSKGIKSAIDDASAAQAEALGAHAGDTDVHVTEEDKARWDSKLDSPFRDGAPRMLARYLYCLDFYDSYPDDAEWYYDQDSDGLGGCSAMALDGFFYRNLDWKFDDAAEFVVRMSSGPGRYASVGVANVGTHITDAMASSGEWSRYYKCLPGRTMDGVNEKGVAACINVVGLNGSVWETKGDRDINAIGAVRWVLDHASSAAEAAAALASRVYIPESLKREGFSCHFMVVDGSERWLVEDGEAELLESGEGVMSIMTNYRIGTGHEMAEGDSGTERVETIRNAHATSPGVGQLEAVWYTKAYSPDTAWLSDFGGDEDFMRIAKEKWAEKPKEEHRGETQAGEYWWQTLHTSSYDLAGKVLRLAVQETDDWYVFQPPVTVPEAVSEHIADSTIHVTATEKAGWNAKADKVSEATVGHLAGLNASGNPTDSGITATSVSTAISDASEAKTSASMANAWISSAGTPHVGDSSIHVSSLDRTYWNGKANTSDIPTVDAALNPGSPNPVQSKVIQEALAGKQNTLQLDMAPTPNSYGVVVSTGLYSEFLKYVKLEGTATGAAMSGRLGWVTAQAFYHFDQYGYMVNIDLPATAGTLALTSQIPDITGKADKAELPYTINSDGTIKDRAINTVSSGAWTIPSGFTDLLIRFTGTPSSLTFAETGITDFGDDLPSASGNYLVTVTRTKAKEAYIRVLAIEERS